MFENAPSAAADSTTEGKSDLTESLKEQLSDALAQIQRLKAQITDRGSELRQRKSDGAQDSALSKASTTLQQQVAHPAAETGVPVQIVAALCLLSFLLAYFLF